MTPVTGSVRIWLRLEGFAVLATSFFFYQRQSASWLLFAVLFFAPDLSMLGYFAGPRIGAAAYNIVHSYLLPLIFLLVAIFTAHPAMFPYALIWTAHIGFDRLLGYGLKYPSAFGDTHLGRIGRGN